MSDPCKSQIEAQLARVLGSPDFAASAQLTNFLRFVVNETLEGRGEDLKERTIAIRALSRDRDFDPRTDSAVRVLAIKLRRSLEHYYLSLGATDSIRISIPKGGYRPDFSSGETPACSPHAKESVPRDEVKDFPRVARPEANQVTTVNNSINASASSYPANNSVALQNKLRSFIRIRNVRTVVLACSAGLIGFLVSFAFPPPHERHLHRPPPHELTMLSSHAPTRLIAVSVSSDGETALDIRRLTGALPYRFEEGKLQVLLVRSREDSHWTIPKGATSKKDTPNRTVLSEALSEAGVVGAVDPYVVGMYMYVRDEKWYAVDVRPIEIQQCLTKWPEDYRRRQWFDIDQAAETINNRDLRQLIIDFHAQRQRVVDDLTTAFSDSPPQKL